MPLEPDDEVLGELKRRFKGEIISGREAVRRATDECLGEHADDPDWIKANFSHLVERAQVEAYEKYLESEKNVAGGALRDVLGDLAGEEAGREEVLELFESQLHTLDRFFLSLTQGRRPRAGAAFEYVVRRLLDVLGYPYISSPEIGGRPDLVMPSEEYYRKNPLGCIIFTIKRSLRERWRQIVTEGANALGFYLATIDKKVGERDLQDMMASKIYLVVPERLLDEVEQYGEMGNVISYEAFFRHHLDPAMRRWVEAGALD